MFAGLAIGGSGNVLRASELKKVRKLCNLTMLFVVLLMQVHIVDDSIYFKYLFIDLFLDRPLALYPLLKVHQQLHRQNLRFVDLFLRLNVLQLMSLNLAKSLTLLLHPAPAVCPWMNWDSKKSSLCQLAVRVAPTLSPVSPPLQQTLLPQLLRLNSTCSVQKNPTDPLELQSQAFVICAQISPEILKPYMMLLNVQHKPS